jgi:hypothetical protein
MSLPCSVKQFELTVWRFDSAKEKVKNALKTLTIQSESATDVSGWPNRILKITVQGARLHRAKGTSGGKYLLFLCTGAILTLFMRQIQKSITTFSGMDITSLLSHSCGATSGASAFCSTCFNEHDASSLWFESSKVLISNLASEHDSETRFASLYWLFEIRK